MALAGIVGGPQFLLEQSNDCLKVFCPARLPFPGLLARKSRLLLGLFVFVPLVFPACQLLQFQVWDTRGKRKTKEVITDSPRAPRSPAGWPSSP